MPTVDHGPRLCDDPGVPDPPVAQGLEGPTARLLCPQCGALTAVFLTGPVLVWAMSRGRRCPPHRLAPTAVTVTVTCPGCDQPVRATVDDVTRALERSVKGRPKRVDCLK